MNVTATELKIHLGRYLDAIEDKYWGDLAMQAKEEGVYQGDAMAELLKIAEEKGVTLDSPLP